MQTYMTQRTDLTIPKGDSSKAMIRALILLMLVGFSVSAWAQNANLEVLGTLEHEESRQSLVNPTVRVLQNGEPFDQIEADRNGQYFMELPLRGNYVLIFEAEGSISKRVQVDGAVLPEDAGLDGFRLELDMALFDYIDDNPEGFRILVRDSPVSQSSGSFASLIVDIAAQVEHLLAREFDSHDISTKYAAVYSQALVGMVALTGQWWLDVRKPGKDDVVAHLVNLAWNGLEHMEPKPALRTVGEGRRRKKK